MARSDLETRILERAKARLDRLDYYPAPVRIDRVRILTVPWLFRIPGFRRLRGDRVGPLILVRMPLASVPEDLVVHELCHVWQDQQRRRRMRWAFLDPRRAYRESPHEIEARRAVLETRPAA